MSKQLEKRKDLNPDREPWTKQTWESNVAFQAFAMYRDLGPTRSLATVAKELGKSEGMIGTWSSKNRWVERVDAYQVYVDGRLVDARASEQEQVVRDQQRMAMMLQEVVESRLTVLTADDDPDDLLYNGQPVVPLHPNELEAKDIPRFVDAVFKQRRLAAGLATEHNAVAVHLRDFERWVDKFIEITLPFVAPEQRTTWLEKVMGLGTTG